MKEGDVIATLSDEAREAQVAEARGAGRRSARPTSRRRCKLIKRGIIAANEQNQLEADLRAAEAALAMAKAEYERGLIRAPISGVVSDVPVTTGQALRAERDGRRDHRARPDARGRRGRRAPARRRSRSATRPTCVSSPARRRRARCATSRRRRASGTRTYRVEVELDNADRAIPDGVTAEVEFKLAPVAAVRDRRAPPSPSPPTASSACASSAPTASSPRVPVAIVEDARDEVWVSGPKDGAKIIVQGQDFVKDGQKVETVDAADAPRRR